jgi:aminopeptidase-like protein
MILTELKDAANASSIGRQAYDLVKALFPICRSISGDGVRQTLKLLQRCIPLQVHEVASGTRVFDWTIPREWNIRDAFVKNARGERVVDFRRSNLHILNYSVPVRVKLTLDALKPHLYTLANQPDWIPYKTSYYKEDWGFCLSHNQLCSLENGEYEVMIDSSLEEGHLTYGEFFIPGRLADEVLISTHICHPSLANDNLSGVCIAAMLAQHMRASRNRYSYRFLFIPGTIGAITWLSLNFSSLERIKHGLVLTGIGDRGPITYKKSRGGDAEIDRIAAYVLQPPVDGRIIEFSPYGYDERQYCAPGINLPVGRLSRTPYGEYPEYHTSADNLDFVNPASMGESFLVLANMLWVLEGNTYYANLAPYGEPQLGRRGLYDNTGPDQMAMLWVLNLSDGLNSLLDIAVRSGVQFRQIKDAADKLHRVDLLKQQTKVISDE